MADRPIQLVLVDDHALMREGLNLLLKRAPGVQVVAKGGTGKSALALAAKHNPDVLVLDLMLPDVSGMDVLRTLSNSTNVLALSMRNDAAFVAEAFRHGATGYLLKEDSPDELLNAVEAVSKGTRYLSRHLDVLSIQRALHARNLNGLCLTPREQHVLELAATGATSAGIAKQLDISPRTVEMHRTKAMRKLGLTSQTDLVRYAIRNRIIAA